MNDPHELSDAPLSNGDAHEAPVIPMVTADAVAKPKPKKKKKKKAKAVRNLGQELVQQASASVVCSVPSSSEEPPSAQALQSGADGDFDRGERFREAFQPAPASPTDVAPVEEQMAPPLRSRIAHGEFDKYVVIGVCTLVAAFGAAVGFGLIPIPV